MFFAALPALVWAATLLVVPALPPLRAAQAATKANAAPPPAQRIDINHASVGELLKLPGMTPSWAGRIVRFRPYRTRRDLLDRGVLPGRVYDRIKSCVIAHRDKE